MESRKEKNHKRSVLWMALGIPVACVIVIGFIYLIGYMFQLPLPFLKKHSSSSSSSAKRASANISLSYETIRSLGLTSREINYMQDFMRRSAWWKTISAEYCPTDWTLIDPENYRCQNRSGNNLGKCGSIAGFKSYTKDYPSGPSGIQLPQDQGKLTFRRSKKGWASKYMCNVDWSNAKDNHPPSSDDLFVAFSKTPEFQTELSRIRVRELSYDEKQYMISIMHASPWWKSKLISISAEYCPMDWTLTDPDNYKCRAENPNQKCGKVAVFRGYKLDYHPSKPTDPPRSVNNGAFRHTKVGWAQYCGMEWPNAQDNHPPSSEELLYDFSKTTEFQTELVRYRKQRQNEREDRPSMYNPNNSFESSETPRFTNPYETQNFNQPDRFCNPRNKYKYSNWWDDCQDPNDPNNDFCRNPNNQFSLEYNIQCKDPPPRLAFEDGDSYSSNSESYKNRRKNTANKVKDRPAENMAYYHDGGFSK